MARGKADVGSDSAATSSFEIGFEFGEAKCSVARGSRVEGPGLGGKSSVQQGLCLASNW